MGQRYEHLALALACRKNIILHDRDAASKTVLIAKALKNPLRGMPLLLQAFGIVLKDLVDKTNKGIKLGTGRCLLAAITGGTENANILSTVRRSIPKFRAALRRLIP
jgi:hypothetical protein|tara:strand:- start:9157 stop:9477 length:321 start_codon:yes stop_codon:yes gene_type:complete